MRWSNYAQYGNAHIIIEEEGQESSTLFTALHEKSSLKDKVGKKSRRVPGNALGKVTANEGLIS